MPEGIWLEGDAVFLENFQHFPAKAHLGVHHILLDVEGSKPLLSSDAGNRVFRLPAGALHDEGTLVFRRVGVADIDGDAFLSYRKDGLLMEYGGSHVGQFPEFTVGDGLDDLGIYHDPGIGNKETGNVGPVLIDICMDGSSNQRTGDIGPPLEKVMT